MPDKKKKKKKLNTFGPAKTNSVFGSIESTMSAFGAALGSPQAKIIRQQDRKRRRK